MFLDTAGRLHVDEELMEQLKVMKAAVDPDEILLVVDAMIGQDAVNAAKAFDEALDITGVMLTKLDGDARGGAALSIKAVTGKPIKFVGVGEKLDQVEVFHPDRMSSRILGMGDVLSLIEKAQQNFDLKKAAELQEKMKKNRLTLTDFYDQLVQFKGMGSMQDLAGMLPGVDAKALEGADDVAAAMRLKGKTVSIDRTGVELPDGRHFLADLMGLEVRDADTGAVLGHIADILTPPAHEVYVVRGGAHEYMIPAVDAFLAETNVEDGYIRVRLIEGMASDG